MLSGPLTAVLFRQEADAVTLEVHCSLPPPGTELGHVHSVTVLMLSG